MTGHEAAGADGAATIDATSVALATIAMARERMDVLYYTSGEDDVPGREHFANPSWPPVGLLILVASEHLVAQGALRHRLFVAAPDALCQRPMPIRLRPPRQWSSRPEAAAGRCRQRNSPRSGQVRARAREHREVGRRGALSPAPPGRRGRNSPGLLVFPAHLILTPVSRGVARRQERPDKAEVPGSNPRITHPAGSFSGPDTGELRQE